MFCCAFFLFFVEFLLHALRLNMLVASSKIHDLHGVVCFLLVRGLQATNEGMDYRLFYYKACGRATMIRR